MGHNATKVLLGTTRSSNRVVSEHDSDPTTFLAGLAVSLNSSAALSLASADGARIGVSLGKSLSDTTQTAVCRKGLKVPLRVMSDFARGDVTITNFANLVATTPDTLAVAGVTFAAQSGAATLGQATFRAATSNNATAASLAAQINAHATSGALVHATASNAVVHIRALSAGDGGEALTLVYTDNHSDIGLTVTGSGTLIGGGTDFTIAKGAVVYIDSATGKATESNSETAVVSNAIYAEAGTFTGIDESGSNVTVALIDMSGGL